MKIPNAKYNYGDRVKVRWHEAECGISDCVVVGIRLTSSETGVEYTVKEIKSGQLPPGSTDGIDENMIFLY